MKQDAKNAGIDRRTFLKGAGAATLANASARTAQPAASSPTRAGAPSPPARRMDRVVYRGERLRAWAMPLGGIGTGSIALAGDGGLRQWQIVHNVYHLAHVPHSFFAFWAKPEGGPSVARVLQSSALYDQADFQPPATTNDHVVPAESKRLLERLPGVKELECAGEYPIAELRYRDPVLPAEVTLEAYSPFIPLNAKDSGLPVIIFDFEIRNPGLTALRASLLATLQNLVGWDGHSPVVGVENFAYGSNRNLLSRSKGVTAVDMSNPRLPADFPFQGGLALAALTEEASYLTQWDDPDLLWRDFSDDGALANQEGEEPSAPGRTWNGALAVPLSLDPGEGKRVVFLLAWFFPNRYVNWSQPAFTIQDRKTKFWLGTMSANWFSSALDVVHYVRDNFPRLEAETRAFRDSVYDSSLPYELLDCVTSQASIIRTPTCLWIQDGHLHGFEGCCGASTSHCENSGCCPLNCTHVWNYEQSLSRLFPDLERTMRQTDLEVQQAPAGYIPHRTILPFYLPRPWGRKIGGPENPALDGMLGTVLKTYREYRQGAGRDWLVRLWPRVAKLMDYIMSTLDADGDGVIHGEQPNTYDISIYGPNSFIGTLYLAALRAAEEMAHLVNDEDLARRYRGVFEKGRVNLPAEIWNGEYYVQKVDLQEHPSHQYGTGCHSDQLLGQWWAHQLELGYLLPEDQVRATLRSIVRYNWREDFAGFKQEPRVFASENDKGLLICSWPRGGKPQVPTLYSDEVWTGVEYEVAGLLLQEGMVDGALKIMRGARGRYDGRKRSPWNDVECGDHYARAMSSWTLLEAAAGQRYNASEGFLAFDPRIAPENFRCFFITAGGWGTFEQRASAESQVETLTGRYGRTKLLKLEFACQREGRKASASLNGKALAVKATFSGRVVRVEASGELALGVGDTLRVEIA
jgi:non-lysosomal glucosylceramidase